jgi:DNA-binding winged helix-turn-helix (wHTH) protein/Tol biopolymer transport system component
MSLPAESQSFIRFGEFQLDLDSAELRTNGTKTSLQGQPLQILSVLLENPGRVVTRDELKKILWPSDTFVDFDQSLNRAVNRLRDALGDSAEQPRFIETLSRRGYRFIAPVNRDSLAEATPAQVSPWLASTATHDSPLTSSVKTRDTGWQRRLVSTGILVGLFVFGAIALVTWRWSSRTQPVSLENLEMNKLTDVGTVKNVAISQDGRYVAYAVDLGEKQALRLRQVATRSDVEILQPDAGNFVGLTFSPDGNYIYFVRSDRNDMSFRYLYAMPSLGGTPRKVITDVDSGISFSPDGRTIAYEHWIRNDMELRIANVDGTDQRLITVVHDANFLSPGDPGPTWSPDGRTIAISKLLVGKKRRWTLFAVSTADGRSRELYSDEDALGRPLWLPRGDMLLLPHYDRNVRRTQLWTVSFPSGTAHRFTHDLSDYSTDLDLTRDGGTVGAITSVVQSQIWVSSSADLENVHQFTQGDPPMYEVKVNPDGNLVSADLEDGRLWVMDAGGIHRSTLGNVQGVNWFTICGRTIVLTSNEQNSTALLRLDADGTRVTKLASGNLWYPTCSPDNRSVYYVNWEQPEKIWRVPLEGGLSVEVAQVLGDSIMGNITVSPDGKYIAYPYSAYTSTTPGRHLAVVPAVGGPPVALFDMPGDNWNVGPYWTSDGKALQYLQIRDGISNILEQALDGGPPRQLTRFTSGRIFDFAWSRDRNRLFLTRGSVSSDVVLLRGFQ